MLLSLKEDHKQHLSVLFSQPPNGKIFKCHSEMILSKMFNVVTLSNINQTH